MPNDRLFAAPAALVVLLWLAVSPVVLPAQARVNQENAEWVNTPLNVRSDAAIAAHPMRANTAGRHLSTNAGAIKLPPGTKVEAEIDDKPLTLKPEEQIAFLFVMSMDRLELEECEHQLHKLCSLEEMASGVAGRKIGLTANPNEDTNYQYTVTIQGTKYQIAAIPQHPGLAGFLYTGIKAFNVGHFYYNPAGPATPGDRGLTGYGNQGEDFRRK